MAKKKSRLPKYKQIWNKVRKRAPRVPDITCPAIDNVINKLESMVENQHPLTRSQYKTLAKKMERLRTANEQLRESGRYWHDTCETVIEEHIGKKNKPHRWY
jgi:hypothetical protein